MKTASLLSLILSAVLPACGDGNEDKAPLAEEKESTSHLLTDDEVKAVEEMTSYRPPPSPNPEGITEDDIVVVRDGNHYRMGYIGDDGSFIEIPERGFLEIDDSGFLPPYPIYAEGGTE